MAPSVDEEDAMDREEGEDSLDEESDPRPPTMDTSTDLPAAASTQDAFLTGAPTETFFTEASMQSAYTEASTVASLPTASVTATAFCGVDGEEEPASARHGKLLVEAEMRAEHQAAARETMLDLARALDETHAQRRLLAELLRQEQQTSEGLRLQNAMLEQTIEEMDLAEEKRLAEELVKKCFESGNSVVFGMLLEKSREGFDTDLFQRDGEGKADTKITWETLKKGDKVTFSWMLKLWWNEVLKSRRRRADEEEARRKREEEEERRRKMQEEIERRVNEVRRMAEELQRRLEAANELIQQHLRRIRELEDQLAGIAGQYEERERLLREAQAKLQAELEAALLALAASEERVRQLELQLQEIQNAYRRLQEESEAERKKLLNQMRELKSELEQAVILAKHMRETALKAKRDAAGCVSPEKFARLIAELEEMKDKLTATLKEHIREKESNQWLNKQLESKQRRLELERQFLPLLHRTRGPLGPKAPGAPGEKEPKRNNASIPYPSPLDAGAGLPGEKKLRMSQSMSAFNPRAGGPLAGGP